ncbi:MAG: sugar phosphate nucleotidyltransferase, partial [Cyanobacteriota bacterium]|nr:sugar phosphate nucleotidyltransferase [Cyanobacteriota bacterium]
FQEWEVDYYLILSGDHLYRMDYRDFINRHIETGADVTLSVLPIDEDRASDFGLMKIDDSGRIVDFSEKPKGEALKQMAVDTTTLGLDAEQAKEKPYIASMGIYVFNKSVLQKLLEDFPDQTDFGKEIIPNCSKDYSVQAYLFDEYWEDIGTIRAFYDANLALTQQPEPAFSFYDEKSPIYTRSRYLPPTKLLNSQVTESMIAEGCIIKECRIHHCVLGLRSRIEAGCVIEDSLLMGADYYEPFSERESGMQKGGIPLGIGANTTIRGAIVDKNARIGRNVQIINKDGVEESNREDEGFYIRGGVVVVLKNATIADGTVI